MYEQLIRAGVPELDAKKVIAYFNSDKNSKPVWDLNDDKSRLSLAVKYSNAGLVLDGTNVVITGRNRAFITAVGFKNKVLSIYPEAEFDIQLVSEGDEFNFEKNSGVVTYHHKFNDPFGAKPIIGAYAFVKTDSGQVLEFLDRPTFEKMKKTAMMQKTWNDWESEFWLKSVIKRVCKRKFNDAVKEIEDLDNEDYDLKSKNVKNDVEALDENIDSAITFLEESDTIEELKERWSKIDSNIMGIAKVLAAKDSKKAELIKESKSDK